MRPGASSPRAKIPDMIEQFLSEALPAVLDYRLALAALAAMASALIRGYAGFGVAMMMVPSLSMLYGPIEAIAITIMVGFVGQSQLLPPALGKAHWPELGPLLIAVILSAPLGTMILFAVDPQIVRRVIGILVLGASITLATGWSYKGPRGTLQGVITGLLCGSITGATGLGAPIAAVYFLASSHAVAVQRANIIITMCTLIMVILIPFAWSGNIDQLSIARSIGLFPIAIFGTWLGNRLFRITGDGHYKHYAIGLLILTGFATVIF